MRRTWLETDRRPLDTVLPEIVATFLVLAPILADRTRMREEEARIWAERQRQLELERQRRQQDDNRWIQFGHIAAEWQQAELARAFVARLRMLEMPETESLDGRSLTEWLNWAEGRANASDPLQRGPADLFKDIAGISAWTNLR